MAAFAAAVAAPAFAQNYPAKTIRIVIAQAPGSATDVISRIVGNRLGEALGQSMVVDARPGAGGVLGTEIAARAPADGYTLFMGNNSTHGSNPALYSKLPYDAIKDFSPIILVVATPYVLNVHPSLPVKTVKELIVFAKARPGQHPPFLRRIAEVARGHRYRARALQGIHPRIDRTGRRRGNHDVLECR